MNVLRPEAGRTWSAREMNFMRGLLGWWGGELVECDA
jgi:hypothetical protein